jgi:hypothetical protein
MPFPRPVVNIREVPRDFDALVDWLEAWSYNLVLLEGYSLPHVQRAVHSVSAAVRAHCASADRWLGTIRRDDEEVARGVELVLSDHVWFSASVEEFLGLLHVVEGEDQGGHRQALGQYGRILAEALHRHRRDEVWLEATTRTPPDAGTSQRSGKP